MRCKPCAPMQARALRGSGRVDDALAVLEGELSGTLGTDEEIAAEVSKQLVGWFGADAATWRLLKVYRIAYCQPNGEPPSERNKEVQLGDFLFVTGDHRETASLNGALRSGVRCADKVEDAMKPALLRRSQVRTLTTNLRIEI